MSKKKLVQVSEQVGDNVISQMFLARSVQKYKAGVRSGKKVVFKGKELKGQYLVSTYLEGTWCVITTPDWQWIGLTQELGEHMEAALVDNHKKTATITMSVIYPTGATNE